jgi:hypothetical protein
MKSTVEENFQMFLLTSLQQLDMKVNTITEKHNELIAKLEAQEQEYNKQWDLYNKNYEDWKGRAENYNKVLNEHTIALKHHDILFDQFKQRYKEQDGGVDQDLDDMKDEIGALKADHMSLKDITSVMIHGLQQELTDLKDHQVHCKGKLIKKIVQDHNQEINDLKDEVHKLNEMLNTEITYRNNKEQLKIKREQEKALHLDEILPE